MINIGKYIRLLGNTSEIHIPDIPAYIPTPTDSDYERGYITRYFVRKANDRSSYIFEVNSDGFSKLNSSPFYILISLRWRISGEIDEVRESNKKSIKLSSLEMNNIGMYLPNLLQFHYRKPSKIFG